MADNTPRPQSPSAQVGQRDADNTGSAAGGQKEYAVSSNPTMNNDNPNVQRTTQEDKHEDDGQGDKREKNPKNEKSTAHPAQREDDGNPNGTRSSTASNGAGTP